MAIFGRSKKSKPTTPRPQPQSNYNPEDAQPSSTAVISNPNWAYIEQRPDNPYGNGFKQQSQGWLIAPIRAQYQPLSIGGSESTRVSFNPNLDTISMDIRSLFALTDGAVLNEEQYTGFNDIRKLAIPRGVSRMQGFLELRAPGAPLRRVEEVTELGWHCGWR
jgi:hypothetical protein